MILELLFLAMAVFVVWRNLPQVQAPSKAPVVTSSRKNPQLTNLIGYAQRLYGEKKYLAAEKAFLGVIKQDHKNTNAYSHLSRIYLKLHNYPDAIECCQILSQLEPSATNYNNLGLIFLENKNYIKALAAFEKAIMFKPTATSYAATARVYTKLANMNKAVAALEKAVELDDSKKYLYALAEGYKANRQTAKAKEAYLRILAVSPDDPEALLAVGQVKGSLENVAA